MTLSMDGSVNAYYCGLVWGGLMDYGPVIDLLHRCLELKRNLPHFPLQLFLAICITVLRVELKN